MLASHSATANAHDFLLARWREREAERERGMSESSSVPPPPTTQRVHVPKDAFDVLRESRGRGAAPRTSAARQAGNNAAAGARPGADAAAVRYRPIRTDAVVLDDAADDAGASMREPETETDLDDDDFSELSDEAGNAAEGGEEEEERAKETTERARGAGEKEAACSEVSSAQAAAHRGGHRDRDRRKDSKRSRPTPSDSYQHLFYDDAESLASEQLGSMRSAASAASKQRRETHRRMFRVPGIACVGCNLAPDDLRPVAEFVVQNCIRMEKTALYKAAARVYSDQVVAPRMREGVVGSPAWSWVDIHTHFEEHVLHEKLMAADQVTGMRAARRWCEQRLVRESDAPPAVASATDGAGAAADGAEPRTEPALELDRKHADMYAKLLPLEAAAAAKLFGASAGSRSAA